MAFWGKAFVFDGVPCEEYDLMLYDVAGEEQGEGDFASTVSIVEEAVGGRWKPYFYGTQYNKRLTFDIVFGVNTERLDRDAYLDRYEISAVAAWLTGHDQYMWLEIDQDDMRYVRYKCMISALSIVTYGRIPWAMKATVVCDSPYGYLYPQEFTYEVEDSETFKLYNESSHNGYIMPEMEITMTGETGGGTVSIVNVSDGNREFKLTNMPATVEHITVDNDHCILKEDEGTNLYPYFNYNFFRLKKGYNKITITGTCTVKLKCEFPVNFGG